MNYKMLIRLRHCKSVLSPCIMAIIDYIRGRYLKISLQIRVDCPDVRRERSRERVYVWRGPPTRLNKTRISVKSKLKSGRAILTVSRRKPLTLIARPSSHVTN